MQLMNIHFCQNTDATYPQEDEEGFKVDSWLSPQSLAYVEEPIRPDRPGRVRYQATYWFGICQPPQSVPRGTEVIVTGREGNTLIVKPITACRLFPAVTSLFR